MASLKHSRVTQTDQRSIERYARSKKGSPDNMDQTQMLIAAVTGLAGCIAWLYKQQIDNHKSICEKLSDCEGDREDLWKEIAKLNGGNYGN